MKKLLILIVVALVSWQLWQSEKNKNNQNYTIGILQIVEHSALDETRSGITKKLKALAKKEGKNLKVFYESAQNNTALASQIAQNYVGKKVNAIVTLGTTATQTSIRASQGNNIPVIFASVSDPIHAKIVNKSEEDSPSVTGVSNYVSPEKQLKYFKSIFPQIKKVGILYNPGEDNSVVLKDRTEIALKSANLDFQSAPAYKVSEVTSAARHLAATCDAIFINNDNTSLSAIESVGRVCKKNGVLLLSSDLPSFKQGADSAVGPDQYALGEQVAMLLWRILKQGKITKKDSFEKPNNIFIKAVVMNG